MGSFMCWRGRKLRRRRVHRANGSDRQTLTLGTGGGNSVYLDLMDTWHGWIQIYIDSMPETPEFQYFQCIMTFWKEGCMYVCLTGFMKNREYLRTCTTRGGGLI